MTSDSSILGDGWSEEEVLHFIKHCFDRDTNLKVLLGYSSKWFDRRMITILGRDTIQPFMCEGWDLDLNKFRDTRISSEDIPVELGVWEGALFFELFLALGVPPLFEVGVVPIPLGKRTTLLLLGESTKVEKLTNVANHVGEQLEKVIFLAKTNELPPEAERIPALPLKNDAGVSDETLQAYVLEATQTNISSISSIAHDDETRIDIAPIPKEASEANIEITETDRTKNIDEDATQKLDIFNSSPSESEPENQTVEIEVIDAEPHIGFGIPGHRKTFTLGDTDFIKTIKDDDEKGTPFQIVNDAKANVTTFGLPLLNQDSVSSVAEPGDKTSFGLPLISSAEASSVGEIRNGVESEVQTQTGTSPRQTALPDEKTGVAIMIPKEIGEEQTSHATLMGGIGVETDIVERSLRQTVSNPAIVITPNKKSQRGVPGAAIFRARRRSGKVGDFVPTVTKNSRDPIRQTINLSNTQESKPIQKLSEETNPELPNDIVLNNAKQIRQEMKDDWDLRDSADLDPAVFDGLEGVEASSEVSAEGLLPNAAMSILLEAGPEIVEYQEHFLMIDSRDKKVAFTAAEEIAKLGESAISTLSAMFPGRIFVDRYQYTGDTLPAAEFHTPVLDCLIRIGAKAVSAPLNFLNDKSTETRFYATFALLSLDPGPRISEIYERFFDKDHQIQEVAKKVLLHADGSKEYQSLVKKLSEEIQFSKKDHRIEIAADILATVKDYSSIGLLINLLTQQSGRTKSRIRNTLEKLTLKDWSTPYEWSHWWENAKNEDPSKWLIEALDSSNEVLRNFAFEEVKRIPGLELNYQVMQPAKLRRRAQRELRSWFDSK